VDEMIGEVVRKLEDLGLRDDTIIIFQSDHGHSTEIRTFGGGGNAGKYRGHKFTLWEGGIRIPAIISWPGKIPQGQVRDQVAHSSDWMPTIADYAGLSLPDRKIDGESLKGVIKSKTAESPHDVLHWTRNQKWAVRYGKWKLVVNEDGGEYKCRDIPEAKYFLGNMEQDITETTNLADQHPNIVEKMKKMHFNWLESLG
jgi:arylsulfatase A-like enzyme